MILLFRYEIKTTPLLVFYPAMSHCTTHCIALRNVVDPFRVGGEIPPHIEVGPKVAFRGSPQSSALDAPSHTPPA